MAINNGRYAVTGGYIDPNGNIIEETQLVPNRTYSPDHILNQVNNLLSGNKTPAQVRAEDNIYGASVNTNTNTNAFSPAEIYKFKADGYYNQGDNAMANAYGGIANNLGRYSSFANNSLNAADVLLNYVKQNEAGLQGAARGAYNTILGDLQNQRDYVNRMFGPEGELTKEVNTYYDDLGNYLATDAGRQAANIAAQGVHSGASLGSIRAQQNEAYNESFGRYIQAKEQQINAKLNIATNLINFMSNLRKEYGDTTNQYVIDLYKRANDLYNTIAQNTATDIDNYNKALATPTSKGGSGSGTSTTTNILNRYNQLKNAGMTDDQIMAQLGAEGYFATPTATPEGNNIEVNGTARQTTGGSKGTPSQSVGLGDVAQTMAYLYPRYSFPKAINWTTNRVADIFK